MFHRHYRKARILFAASDLVLIAVAFFLAYRFRQALPLWFPEHFPREFYLDGLKSPVTLGAAMLAWVSIAYWLELYERLLGTNAKVIVRATLKQSVLGSVSLILCQFSLRMDLSRPFLFFFFLFAVVLLTLFRLNAPQLVGAFRREFAQPYYVLIVGAGERALRIAERIEQAASSGMRIEGFLDYSPATNIISLARDYPVWSLDRLPDLLRARVIDEVVFAVPSERLAELEEVFLLCDEEGVRTRVAVDFFPHVHSEVYLDRLSEVPLLTFSATPHDEVKLFLKRTIDVLVSAVALLLLTPLLAFLALIIKLTSPGPVIFRQERLGLSGRRFTVFKFRSMSVDAEARKADLEHLNVKTTAFKIPNDPRLTPIGKWLRKFSLDELPQFWNVLRGDMSLVGPRPAVPHEVAQYQRWQRRRLRMRPGLTCLQAVNGRDELDFESAMRLDMEYIDSWSLSLDWKILLRTIPQVLLGKGAY